jgi:hypothetical protein
MNIQQKQIIISAFLGDGCFSTYNKNIRIHFSSIYKEYLEYKKNILDNLSGKISETLNKGYKINKIYQLSTLINNEITSYLDNSKIEILNDIDELGIALWIYDDGSLHKTKHYYNINTHAFTKEYQEKLFIPLLNKFNIYPKIRKENKKDGRIFYYLQVSKYEGSYEITKILEKYPISCFSYKRWSSETIQKWSKFQEELKSMQINIKKISPNKIGSIYRKINLRYSPNYEETHRYVMESIT